VRRLFADTTPLRTPDFRRLWLQAALALNNVWVVLCLLSVQQAFYAINQPTRSAAIPRMLPRQIWGHLPLAGDCPPPPRGGGSPRCSTAFGTWPEARWC
jgi:hypothetical protein